MATINVKEQVRGPYDHAYVRPVSIESDWFTMIAAGGVDDADTGKNPDTWAAMADHNTLKVDGLGTMLMLRQVYDDAVSSVTTDVTVRVVGRSGDSDEWMSIPNRSGDHTADLAIDTSNDLQDGSSGYTSVDKDANVWDVMGCNEVIVQIATPVSTNGNDALAIIQGKMI
jgi:hypothetical protein